MPNDFKYLSPDGKYGFALSSWEARMSLWIDSPTLMEVASNSTLLAFQDSNWSLDSAEWQSNTVVHLELRKYPGDHTPGHFDVVFDCETSTATVGKKNSVPLTEIEPSLEKLYYATRRV